MVPDYYRILMIEPTVSAAEIERAYYRRAMVCHPDRGGSHDQMLLINEAWEILSDPERRRNYDAARAGGADRAAQDAAAADAQRARDRADQYPRRWAEFEKWLGKLAGDIGRAEYGSVPITPWRILLPTVGKSVSGWVFILVGAALGGVLVSPQMYAYEERHKVGFNSKGNLNAAGFAVVAAPILGGAWAGWCIHAFIGGAIAEARKQSAERGQNRPGNRAQNAADPPDRSGTEEPRIIECQSCHQKLRLPPIQAELMLTCPVCRHRFAYRPDSSRRAN